MTKRQIYPILQIVVVGFLLISALIMSARPAYMPETPTPSQSDTREAEASPPEQIIEDVIALSLGSELMIQVANTASPDDMETILVQLDAEAVRQIPHLNAVVAIKTQDITPEQLARLPDSIFVEPNYAVHGLQTYPPNDPLIDEQWALESLDVGSLWDRVDSNDAIVAVIDSGVCFDHPDLVGRFLEGYDYVDDDSIPDDEMGHGCAISGIITANTDNDIGIVGIAPNTQILPLRVLDANGDGTYADVISAIYEAVAKDADIINLSLGGVAHSRLLEQAIYHAISNQVVVVAGAGNLEHDSVLYPANYAEVIAVGSHNINGNRSSFSTLAEGVDTLAPGEDILTTTLDGGYDYFSGTSMAVAHVSGLLALSTLSREEYTATDLTDSNPAQTQISGTDSSN